MLERLILIALFIIYCVIREYFYHKQITQLTKSPELPLPVIPPANPIMTEEENEIAFDDPDFDIKKVNKVFIDGQERDIQIK